MIKYVQGDLLKGSEDIIVHGCNCFNTMGAGVAALIKKLYPGTYKEDCKTISGESTKLGTFTHWNGKHAFLNQDITIVNAYTQYYYNAKSRPFDYDALTRVLPKIHEMFPEPLTIAMPKIGAGLAGGDWNRISGIIETSFGKRPIIVYIIDSIRR